MNQKLADWASIAEIVGAVSIVISLTHFSLATDVKVYFCDPHSPWQRGSNEQTNGLLRQYFPGGMDLSKIPQNRLNAVARKLNERPRMTLGYHSPAERFAECVASIGWISKRIADIARKTRK